MKPQCDDHQSQPSSKSSFFWLWFNFAPIISHTAKAKPEYIILFLAGLLCVIAKANLPMILSYIHIDNSYDTSVAMFLFMVTKQCLQAISNFLAFPILNHSIQTTYHYIQQNIFLNANTKPMSSGELLSKISRIGNVLRQLRTAMVFDILPECYALCILLWKLSSADLFVFKCALCFIGGTIPLFVFFAKNFYFPSRMNAWEWTDLRASMVLDSYDNIAHVQKRASILDAPEFHALHNEARAWNIEQFWKLILQLFFPFLGIIITCIYTAKSAVYASTTLIIITSIWLSVKHLCSGIVSLVACHADMKSILSMLDIPDCSYSAILPKESLETLNQISIELDNICLSIAHIPILHDTSCNITISHHEPLIICGANGSGKSSLCKLLSESISPTQGNITWHVIEPSIQPACCSISYYIHIVSQDIHLVSGNLYHNFEFGNWGSGHNIELIRKALFDVGLQRILTNHPDLLISGAYIRNMPELSKGEIHRIAIAKALLSKAAIVILDETLDNIDCSSITHMIALFKTYNKLLIIVTHNPYIRGLSSNVLSIQNFKIEYHQKAFVLV